MLFSIEMMPFTKEQWQQIHELVHNSKPRSTKCTKEISLKLTVQVRITSLSVFTSSQLFAGAGVLSGVLMALSTALLFTCSQPQNFLSLSAGNSPDESRINGFAIAFFFFFFLVSIIVFTRCKEMCFLLSLQANVWHLAILPCQKGILPRLGQGSHSR